MIGSGFDTPYGVAVDRHGNVFVTDNGDPRLQEVPEQDSTRPSIGCAPAGAATQTCTVAVSDTSVPSVMLRGLVEFISSGPGFYSGDGSYCVSSGGSCSVSYTSSGSASQTITASEEGNENHAYSSGPRRSRLIRMRMLGQARARGAAPRLVAEPARLQRDQR